MTSIELNLYLTHINKALDLGEKESLSRLSEFHKYYGKGNRDYALDVDCDIETRVKFLLNELDPTIPMLGEEFQWGKKDSSQMSELFWVLDPIDGTINYSRQIPLFGVSLALIHINQPIVAGIAFPMLGERYTASQGSGSFLNKDRIYVSETAKVSDSVIGFGDFSVGERSYDRNVEKHRLMQFYAEQALRIRMPGSAALQLAWLASGKIDISLTLSNKAWDVQAGVLIVREAGGEVFDLDGSNHNISSKYTLASNSYLKQNVLDRF